MVGMRFAISAPKRIGRLVLACTSARFGVPAEWQDRASLVRARGMQAVAYDALDKWFTPGFGDRERFLDIQLTTPAEDYALGLEAIGSFDVRSELASVDAPTLVISGPGTQRRLPQTARTWPSGFRARGTSSFRTPPTWRTSSGPTRSTRQC
jgi:pimeloyl-ACP methyl ester carboxylesterase